jgi:multicomponent Na+:H+ antiporter subunit B
MIKRYLDIIAEMASIVMVPFIFLFALYVLFFGHHSPGGGFQAGAIMASAVMLLRMTLGREVTRKKFPPRVALILGAIGVMIYAGTGLTCLFCGGNFLDYSSLPIPWVPEAARRYLGILFVELGVGLGVFGVMVSIFDSLSKEPLE